MSNQVCNTVMIPSNELAHLRTRLEALRDERDSLRGALGDLGVIGDGYCFCSENRDPHKEQHQPECRLARAALNGEGDD